MSDVSSRFVKANGIQFAVHECGQEYRSQQPTLVLVHATGFHGRCWDQVIHRLQGRHVIAIDQRGHGASEHKTFHNWSEFGEDLAALLTELDVSAVQAVGHSMGGHVSVAAAAQYPKLFSKLLLIDPVILEPSFYPLWNEQLLAGEPTHPAVRRREQFSSRDDMFNRYRERLPFSLFTEAALRDYCSHGLVNNEEGVRLACAPAHEARIYDSACSNQSILEQVKMVTIPVTVVRSMQPTKPDDIMHFRYSPTWKQLASEFPNGKDRLFEHLTHFMPMEDPDQVAQLIREL